MSVPTSPTGSGDGLPDDPHATVGPLPDLGTDYPTLSRHVDSDPGAFVDHLMKLHAEKRVGYGRGQLTPQDTSLLLERGLDSLATIASERAIEYLVLKNKELIGDKSAGKIPPRHAGAILKTALQTLVSGQDPKRAVDTIIKYRDQGLIGTGEDQILGVLATAYVEQALSRLFTSPVPSAQILIDLQKRSLIGPAGEQLISEGSARIHVERAYDALVEGAEPEIGLATELQVAFPYLDVEGEKLAKAKARITMTDPPAAES